MLDILWTILFCIFLLTGIPVVYSGIYNWSNTIKIFLVVLQLCLCSVLIVLGFCSNQSFSMNLLIILTLLGLLKVLKNRLEDFEDEVIQKVRESQKTRTKKPEIIDVEGFSVED